MRFAVAGCAGRTGKLVMAEILEEGHEIVAGTVSPRSGLVGTDLGDILGPRRIGVLATDDPKKLFDADVVIDFSSAGAVALHAELAAMKAKPIVIGTTGLDKTAERAILAASQVVPVLRSSNFSRGVALLEVLVAEAAARLGRGVDTEILEMHHRNKADSPSGTAMTLGRAVATARGQDIDIVGVKCRPDRRVPEGIGFASLRGGSVIGDHTVIFALDGERLELTHRAEDRSIYAKGAVSSAIWLARQPPGLYAMRDYASAEAR